ncbi:oxidoreductase [Salmonella enterica subsp. enterica]|uniref:Oxidoreductase n=1 Tax=Salmonella enterica I TaxID=59201 RepID=A0A3S4I2P0_SALET|nr:oxidoreductase [Salmonella enterica subsp. enterica]
MTSPFTKNSRSPADGCVTASRAFRLPQSVLDQEIARIVEMGVNIKCNCEVGGSLSLAQLKAEYRAVLMTVGMSCGSDLPLFEQASHVEIAVDFLQRARQADGDI